MSEPESIRCRMAACRESLGDGKEWSFYLINDGADSLESAVLDSIDFEWGDFGKSESTRILVADIQPGGNALVWRDDGSGAEVRMELALRVRTRDAEARLRFEFPKLYRKTDLPEVNGLGRRGWQVSPQR